MTEVKGRSDTSSMNVSTGGREVRKLEFDADPFRVMPEIVNRAYHQQAVRQQPVAVQQASALRGGTFGTVAAPAAPRFRPEIGSSVDPHAKRMQDLEFRTALAQLQALTNPAPTREVGGFNMITGRTLDPLKMNAMQRQMFLPQNSEMIAPMPNRSHLSPQAPNVADALRFMPFNPWATGPGVVQGQMVGR